MLSLDKCYDRCRTLALSHYENFPVGSVLLPGSVRKHVFALYAFMRTADDIADVPGRTFEERLALLRDLRQSLEQGSDDPIVIAVRNTLDVCRLDVGLLCRLLEAFEFDARGNVHFDTFADLRWYTARSAEPVGALILQLFGYRSAELLRLSNEITSGLQILNFIQDVREDIANGRCYFPVEDCVKFGIVAGEDFGEHPRAPELLAYSADRVEEMLRQGARLPEMTRGRLRYELRAIVLGALALLNQMRAEGFQHVRSNAPRPVVGSGRKLMILTRALIGAV